MELRQLRYFVTVADELHFGRAAQRLGIVQPAVSQQISRLERQLGVRLFDRTPRRVALSAEGERLLPLAHAVLDAAGRLTVAAAGLAGGGMSGVLRIGTSPGLGERLHRGLARLRETAPDLDVKLVDGDLRSHVGSVLSGALDVALVRDGTRTAGLHSEQVWREPLAVVLPATHPLAGRATLAVPDLGEVVLRLPADAPLAETVLAACRAAAFTPCRGRPVGSTEDALVEIAASAHEATVVYAGTRVDLDGVTARPLDPAVTVPGYLLSRVDPQACRSHLAAAFADR